MKTPSRDLYWVILVAVVINSMVLLDSLERYFNARYHIYISGYFPNSILLPSKIIHEVMTRNEHSIPPVSTVKVIQPVKIVISQPVTLTNPPLVKISPVSGVVVQQVLKIETTGLLTSKPTIKIQHPKQAYEPDTSSDHIDMINDDSNPKVLFAGDSMMQGVAPMVITRMRKDYPKGVFVDVSKPSTGLVAMRYFDWPSKIREESIKHHIQVIVIFLGPNDPWDIFEGKKRYSFPSESWEDKYRSRVDNVLDFASSSGIRVIWIGLPVMRDERIKKGAKIENRIFQEEAQKYKFDYLSTEDFLGSLDEPYTKYIDDPQKGKLAVRLDDGVHFTHLGLHLISSRVDEYLRKQEKL